MQIILITKQIKSYINFKKLDERDCCNFLIQVAVACLLEHIKHPTRFKKQHISGLCGATKGFVPFFHVRFVVHLSQQTAAALKQV